MKFDLGGVGSSTSQPLFQIPFEVTLCARLYSNACMSFSLDSQWVGLILTILVTGYVLGI